MSAVTAGVLFSLYVLSKWPLLWAFEHPKVVSYERRTSHLEGANLIHPCMKLHHNLKLLGEVKKK